MDVIASLVQRLRCPAWVGSMLEPKETFDSLTPQRSFLLEIESCYKLPIHLHHRSCGAAVTWIVDTAEVAFSFLCERTACAQWTFSVSTLSTGPATQGLIDE